MRQERPRERERVALSTLLTSCLTLRVRLRRLLQSSWPSSRVLSSAVVCLVVLLGVCFCSLSLCLSLSLSLSLFLSCRLRRPFLFSCFSHLSLSFSWSLLSHSLPSSFYLCYLVTCTPPVPHSRKSAGGRTPPVPQPYPTCTPTVPQLGFSIEPDRAGFLILFSKIKPVRSS